MGKNYRPLVDIKGIASAQYETDLRECQQYAAQVAGAAEQAAVGALVGAVFGALLAAVTAETSMQPLEQLLEQSVARLHGCTVAGERDLCNQQLPIRPWIQRTAVAVCPHIALR